MNRLKKWWFSLYWKYTKTSKKITELEAKRYSTYLTESYTEVEQLFILKELHKCLIEYREEQIKNTEIEILQKKEKSVLLANNLNKLTQAL